MTNKKLDLRTEPKQMRAHDRVNAILDVTEKMLASGEKVTTSSIAKKAGIPVGSVYRYFPDLNAIYLQLFEIINGEMLAKLYMVIQSADSTVDWQLNLNRCTDIIRDTYDTHPAFGVLLLLMEDPELRDSRIKVGQGIIDALAHRWRTGTRVFHGEDPDIVARTAVEMAATIQRSYFLEKDQKIRDKMFHEWTLAISAYLNIYLKS
jgi:AcrR family transcriptional regulator